MRGEFWKTEAPVIGVAAFLFFAATGLGMPFDMAYRLVCAGICLYSIAEIEQHYPVGKLAWIGFWGALLINAGLFFTPLFDRPASRGEIVLFAVPDAIVVLIVRLVSAQAGDEHQRAKRQTMMLALVVAVIVLCAGLAAFVLIPGTR